MHLLELCNSHHRFLIIVKKKKVANLLLRAMPGKIIPPTQCNKRKKPFQLSVRNDNWKGLTDDK